MRATHRFSALLVALLWAGAPVLAALHANAEVHRYCAEHGVLEDAAAGEGATGVPVLGGGAAASDAQSSAAHDDCAFARYCQFGQLLTRFALPATGTLAVRTMALPPASTAASTLAILRLAPKTSPPV